MRDLISNVSCCA